MSSPNIARMKAFKFKSLSSGSCGNCYFLGIFEESGSGSHCECAVLVDAGVSPRRLKKELQREGIGLDCIAAMLITHDHLDHIRSLGSYCKHMHLPVWLTPELSRVLSRHFLTAKQLSGLQRQLETGWNEIVPGRISAKYFIVPHDASQTVGFAIMLDGYRFMIMTDAGRMTEEAAGLAGKAQTLVMESNYDYEMLRHGPYPKALQDRICGGKGHLSNAECAEAIAGLENGELRNVFLCHLSEHNNTPQLAFECTRAVLEPSVRLVPLPRQSPSPLFLLHADQED